jgi:SAM-dependent methyltransferase
MKMRRVALTLGGIALLGGGIGAVLRWRANPSACPYRGRFFVELPRPGVTRGRLREVLAPRAGERVLEVGPGTGYYSLHVAEWVAPGGALDILDLQQKMLDHTMARARARGVTNVVPARGDATALPYPDDSFDAAYVVATLGEVPDQDGALRELHRVIRPGGRLVVGEALLDPHRVSFGKLRTRAEEARLEFERRIGGALGYLARFGA